MVYAFPNPRARTGDRIARSEDLEDTVLAALHDPANRTYNDRKRGEGKKHHAALICLARRRRDVLYAMLGTEFERNPLAPASTWCHDHVT